MFADCTDLLNTLLIAKYLYTNILAPGNHMATIVYVYVLLTFVSYKTIG